MIAAAGGRRLAVAVAVSAMLCWLSTFAVPPAAQAHWWLLRGCALAIAMAAAWSLKHRRGWPGLANPVLLMGGLTLVLYVVGPALMTDLRLGGSIPILPGDRSDIVRFPGALLSVEAARRSVASPAELLIVQFVLLCLGVAGLVGMTVRDRPLPPCPVHWRAAMAVGVIAALVNGARRWDAVNPQSWLPAALADQFLAVLPVVATTCLAVLVLACLAGEKRAPAAFAVLAGLFAASFLPFGGKALGWALAVDLLVLGLSVRGRWKAGVVTALLLLPVLLSCLIVITRGGAYEAGSVRLFQRILEMKLVYRQAESDYCLAFVEKAHGLDETAGGSAYFLAGLVPRAVWPEKPSLSLGDRYARDYCGWPADEVATNRHSASITLLGEPLIHGGRVGLAVAQLVILAVLAFTATALSSGRAQAVVPALALTPWLLDFDQHFSMWLANPLKFLMVSVVLTLLMVGVGERRPRKPAQE